MYSGTGWTVVIEDLDDAVGEKRGGQLGIGLSRLLPKGYSRESFAGKQANTLNQQRIAELAASSSKGRRKRKSPESHWGSCRTGS